MPPALKVNIGDRYGRLCILKEEPKHRERRQFLCRCDCGNTGIYRFTSMRFGTIKSCGCLRRQQNATVGITHQMSKTRLYRTWHGMKQRCLNSKSQAYKHYGARGISIHPEWIDFEPFMEWALLSGYKKGLTIERVNVNGNYEPSNCRWATMSEQLRNTRRTVNIEYNGEVMCVQDWANRLGMNSNSLRKRLQNWPLERAINEPIGSRYKIVKQCK